MVLVGNSALKAIGMRHRPERGHRQPQTQVVEQAYLAVPYTEWTERTQPPRRRNNAAAAQEEQKPTWRPYLLSFNMAASLHCLLPCCTILAKSATLIPGSVC